MGSSAWEANLLLCQQATPTVKRNPFRLTSSTHSRSRLGCKYAICKQTSRANPWAASGFHESNDRMEAGRHGDAAGESMIWKLPCEDSQTPSAICSLTLAMHARCAPELFNFCHGSGHAEGRQHHQHGQVDVSRRERVATQTLQLRVTESVNGPRIGHHALKEPLKP